MLDNLIKETKQKILNEINQRYEYFKSLKSKNEIFSELSFCILTANYNAKKAITIQNKIGKKFLELSEDELKEELKKLGYRYPNIRSKYIHKAKEKLDELIKILKEEKDEKKIREWISNNIKGLGYKESSHFLRNIGYENLAIIDFHILDILKRYRYLTKKPKNLTKKEYLKIEKILEKIAKKNKITLGKLDLILWYLETGKVLK